MSCKYILAIDQGTTGTTCLVVKITDQIAVLSKSTTSFKQNYPYPGWVEHNLQDIWESFETSCAEALAQAKLEDSAFCPTDLACIGITNQRETLCLFEEPGESPHKQYPAIVWQCRRSTDICQSWKDKGLEDSIRERTGLLLDPYFSASKLKWWIEKEGAPFLNKLKSGHLKWGTIDTYILYRLTGGKVYATDPSNASRTLFYDLKQKKFSSDLFKDLGFDSDLPRPEIRPSAGDFGQTVGFDFLPAGIPITGILGDQQSALAGQGCFVKGQSKCTYGTGAFLLINSGDNPVLSRHRMLTTVAWQIGDKVTFASEGAVFISGALVQFLRDQFGFFASSNQIENLAKKGSAAPDLYFVPAFTGLGAPHWDPNARGALLGLTRGTSVSDVSRAALEALCFQVDDLIRSFGEDRPDVPILDLRVDGGASANQFMLETQANISDLRVTRPSFLETTSLGAALFAGLGRGIFKELKEITQHLAKGVDLTVLPSGDFGQERRMNARQGWRRAVEACRVFSKRD